MTRRRFFAEFEKDLDPGQADKIDADFQPEYWHIYPREAIGSGGIRFCNGPNIKAVAKEISGLAVAKYPASSEQLSLKNNSSSAVHLFITAVAGYDLRYLPFSASGPASTIQQTDPSQLKTGIHGYDPSTPAWRPILVDASGLLRTVIESAAGSDLLSELQMKLETADLELISKILSIGSHGWLSGAWQKNPLAFGYSDAVVEHAVNTNLPEGASNLNLSVVPAGEIWVFTHLVWRYAGTPPTRCRVFGNIGGVVKFVYGEEMPSSEVLYTLQTFLVLEEGDGLYLTVTDATAGDTARLDAWGFQVDIDQ